MKPIVVTGAGGNVGSAVVDALRQRGQTVRAVDLRPAELAQRFGPDVETAALDFTRPETFADAFAGAGRVFLLRPPAITNVKRDIAPAINAALRAGVEHLVFLSIIGVERNRIVPHAKIEQYIRTTGVPYTFLRPSFFMQNLNGTHRAEIRDRDELFVPAGRGRTSFIDVRDIAAVAALTLSAEGHHNHCYDLTGSVALDYYEVADVLSAVLGRRITYRNPPLWRFVLRQRTQGVALPFVLVMAGIYSTARLGLAGRVTGEVQRLLGRPPTTFRQYVVDYAPTWQRMAHAAAMSTA